MRQGEKEVKLKLQINSRIDTKGKILIVFPLVNSARPLSSFLTDRDKFGFLLPCSDWREVSSSI